MFKNLPKQLSGLTLVLVLSTLVVFAQQGRGTLRGVVSDELGGSIVAAVLASPELRATWEQELGEMRDRIRAMRNGLVEQIKAAGVERDFSFVNRQRGMFSYSGLTSPQVDRLREEFGIYAVGTGRICVAALNTRNLEAVANAIATVLK